jgi:prevent-host-death family protein
MTVTRVSIGQVKRDISELVNRVAFGDERILLTSRGKPKAAIVSMDDFAQLAEAKQKRRCKQWQQWLAANRKLNDAIGTRRAGKSVDVDMIWDASRADLDERHGD